MIAVATVCQKRFEWLTSFLKRRWILLTLFGVLLACTVLEFGLAPSGGLPTIGNKGGNVFIYCPETPIFRRSMIKVAPQRFGDQAFFDIRGFGVPLSVPLVVVLGSILFRELRWRETARASALPSNAGGQSRRSRGIKGDNRAKAKDSL